MWWHKPYPSPVLISIKKTLSPVRCVSKHFAPEENRNVTISCSSEDTRRKYIQGQ